MKSSRLKSIPILVRTFRGYGRYLILLAFLATISAMIDGVSIITIVPLFSFVIGSTNTPTDIISSAVQVAFHFFGIPFKFRNLMFFVAFLLVLRGIMLGLFAFVRSRVNARFLYNKTSELYALTLSARWPFIAAQKSGYLQNVVIWDAKRAGYLLDAVTQFLQSSSGFLIYLLAAISISPTITGLTIVVGALLLFILRPLMKRTRSYGERMAASEKELAQHVAEHVQGFKLVKATDSVRSAIAGVGEELARFRVLYAKSIMTQNIGSIFIQPFGFLYAMAIFGFSYYTGTLNIAAFAAILYLIQKIFTYLDSTQSGLNGITQYIPFAEAIMGYSDLARAAHEDEAEGKLDFPADGALEFKAVSVEYRAGEQALSEVSFQLPSGSMLGLIGPSGGGKTTIADLVLRLISPSSGNILLGGDSISDIRMREWRRGVGYVSQDAFLFHASIADNIRFYDHAISHADIERAARDAHIYEDIMRLPQGFETIVGDRGAGLSGGQRQRVALARALARKPHVLVLDEVTSALDSELEAQIKGVIDELRGKVTLVVIAHRVSTVLNADRILVLEKGKVIADDSPEHMLSDANSYLSRMRALQQGSLVE